jgi:hypothetical protein
LSPVQVAALIRGLLHFAERAHIAETALNEISLKIAMARHDLKTKS